MANEAGKVRRFRYDGDVYFYRVDHPDEDIEYGSHFVLEADYEASERRVKELEQQVAELEERCMVMLAELVAVNCASRHVYALDAINIFAESLAAQEKEHG